MRDRISHLGLSEIAAKLDAGERLTLDDGVRLFECPDLHAVGWLANREREKRHGARTYYNFNIRLEATNVCVASCLFCSFARLKPGNDLLSVGGYAAAVFSNCPNLRGDIRQQLMRIIGGHADPFDGFFDVAAQHLNRLVDLRDGLACLLKEIRH